MLLTLTTSLRMPLSLERAPGGVRRSRSIEQQAARRSKSKLRARVLYMAPMYNISTLCLLLLQPRQRLCCWCGCLFRHSSLAVTVRFGKPLFYAYNICVHFKNIKMLKVFSTVVRTAKAPTVAARTGVRSFCEKLTIPTDKEQQAGRRKEELDAEAAGDVGFNNEPIIPPYNAGTKENPILVRGGWWGFFIFQCATLPPIVWKRNGACLPFTLSGCTPVSSCGEGVGVS
jgi:hypothetical protein